MLSNHSGGQVAFGSGKVGQAVVLVDQNGEPLVVGGGTQYTEGDTDASITGTAAMWEDTGDTLRAVSAAKPLPTTVISGTLTATGTLGLEAGENHVGQVGGPLAYVTSAPTLSVAGAYANGDYIGPNTTPASFANAVRVSAGRAVIQSITIIDKVTTAAVGLELWLFSATITVPADNDGWAISDADALNCVGVIPITTDKWYASTNNKVYSDPSVGRVIKCAATNLFYALVARATTPTWASGDLQISLGLLQ